MCVLVYASSTKKWIACQHFLSESWDESLAKASCLQPNSHFSMPCFAQSLVDPEFEAKLKREGIPAALIEWLVVRCPTAAFHSPSGCTRACQPVQEPAA